MKDLLPETCRNGQHNYIEAYSHKTPFDIDTVLWCKDCGTISVKVEHKNRKLNTCPFKTLTHEKRLISIFNIISLIKVK
jgi:hypothetical protein